MARPRTFALLSFTLAIFMFFSLAPSSCDAQSVIQQASLSSIFSRHTATLFLLFALPGLPPPDLLLLLLLILTRGLLSSHSTSALLRQTLVFEQDTSEARLFERFYGTKRPSASSNNEPDKKPSLQCPDPPVSCTEDNECAIKFPCFDTFCDVKRGSKGKQRVGLKEHSVTGICACKGTR